MCSMRRRLAEISAVDREAIEQAFARGAIEVCFQIHKHLNWSIGDAKTAYAILYRARAEKNGAAIGLPSEMS